MNDDLRPLIDALPVSAGELVAGVVARYAEPWRSYHDGLHLAELAGWFSRISAGPGWRRAPAVALAVLFHDAVYEPGRSDNESRSADLAAAEIAIQMPACGGLIARTRQLILATASHGEEAVDAAADPDLAYFLDADMAILGAPAERYDAYEAQVREEYTSVVPPDLFAAGRRAFLEGVLAADRIFHSDWFHRRLHAQATANVRRAVEALT